MKCPICGKDVELQKKQIGTSETGEPVFNEYAVCRDCKKQWNLDKQRARKIAAKKAAEAENKVSPAPDAAVKKETPDTEASAKKKSVSSESTPKKKTAETESAPKKKTAGSGDMPKKKSSHDRPDAKRRTSESGSSSKSESDEEKSREKTGGKSRSKSASHSARSKEDMNKEGTPVKKPVKKRTVQHSEDENEQKYGNIPSEKVRAKKEKAVRKGYEDMLATDPDRKPVRKKKSSSSEKTKETSESSALKKSESSRHKEDINTSKKKPEPEIDEYDDYEDDYDDYAPRFKAVRIILGILSLLGFAFFIYRGFVTGLNADDGSTSGMNYIIVALCLLVAALLYFIMKNRATIFAFLLPMLFYLGSAVFAFLQREDDMQLLIATVAGAVLAVLSLIFAILSRGGDDYYDDDEDYEDAFEEDHDNY